VPSATPRARAREDFNCGGSAGSSGFALITTGSKQVQSETTMSLGLTELRV
jgi:hypothetical protein